jgi:hypothetical protein
MYQRCFDNASETLFVAGKTPRLSRFAFSDDPKWESGHHVHDNETELIYVKKGVARFTIDSSLYVAHADDIVVIERGRLHAVASDVNDPATTCTCALYGFQFQGAEENQLLQPHSCPVIAAGQASDIDWSQSAPLAELVGIRVPPQTERKHIILDNDSPEAIAELAEHLKKALN